MKHTKEPWSINSWTQRDSDIRIGAAGTPLIATVHLRDCSINEHKANAKLIAASPELLSALELVNSYFKDLQNRYVLTPHEESVWKKISKAIFDATE